MFKVNLTDIVDRRLVCPYCVDTVNDGMLGHCRESRDHFEHAIELTNGEIYLESEIKLTKTGWCHNLHRLFVTLCRE